MLGLHEVNSTKVLKPCLGLGSKSTGLYWGSFIKIFWNSVLVIKPLKETMQFNDSGCTGILVQRVLQWYLCYHTTFLIQNYCNKTCHFWKWQYNLIVLIPSIPSQFFNLCVFFHFNHHAYRLRTADSQNTQ